MLLPGLDKPAPLTLAGSNLLCGFLWAYVVLRKGRGPICKPRQVRWLRELEQMNRLHLLAFTIDFVTQANWSQMTRFEREFCFELCFDVRNTRHSEDQHTPIARANTNAEERDRYY